MMMKYTRVSLLLKIAAIGLLLAVGIALLGWDTRPSPHEVHVWVIPYEKLQNNAYHHVPYHIGMTMRDAVAAATGKHGFPSVDETKMAPLVSRHSCWTWNKVCYQVWNTSINFLKSVGLEQAASAMTFWGIGHRLSRDSNWWAVDAGHSRWDSEVRPSDAIRVFTRDKLAR